MSVNIFKVFVIVYVVIGSCAYCSTSSDRKSDESDNEEYQSLREGFDQGNDDFTANFLSDVIDENPNTSAITSPFSVLFLLSQLALHAKGESYKQLANLLNLRSRYDIRVMVPRYLDDINSQRSVNFSLAERVYCSMDYPFSNAFKRDTRNTYHAQAENLDFSEPEEAARMINAWIASKTNNLITDLVPSSSLNEDTRLVLTNAIYFKGDWRMPFNRRMTKKSDFHVTRKHKVSVRMMNQIGHFNYSYLKNIKAKVIQLFYKDGNFSFVLVLPNKGHSVRSLSEDLQYIDLQNDVINQLEPARVNLTMPVIDTETTTDLADILKKNGVTAIFDYDNSDLSGILKHPEPLYVSSAMQKAKIIVNESGSEAAAGNAIMVGTTAAEAEPKTVRADRPFIYYILFKNTPIFAGTYAGPQKS
ncbi:unnamed protein product [Leptosia nina]|uniref:Serpin domain-containing protein n=1 Tax=Leptosia nina TaxID=320188 RepID=A0AAV1JZE4_9NEOP